MEARWLQQLHPRGCVFSPTCSRSLGAIVFTVSWVVPIPGQLLRPGKCSVWFGLGKGGRGRFPPPRKLGYCFCSNRQRVLGRLCPDFFFWPCLLLCGRVCCYVGFSSCSMRAQ